jgi:hypothetical protein
MRVARRAAVDRQVLLRSWQADNENARSKDADQPQASRDDADELVRPLNESPFRSVGEDTFKNFVEDVFFPMKRESGEWRANTEKESCREIRLHLVTELGDVQFGELTPALVRFVLKKKAEQGLRRQTLNHLKGYLTDICKCAVAEGYLQNNISEGLRAPVKLAKTVGCQAHRRVGAVCGRLDAIGRTRTAVFRFGDVRRHARV